VAFLFLSRRGSAPTKSYFLLTDDANVLCIEWTVRGDKIEGEMLLEKMLNKAEIKTTRDTLNGEISGENVRITFTSKDAPTYIGILKDDTLTLHGGVNVTKYKRVSRAECFEASLKLAERVMEIRAKATPSQ
jgi:hypothetical protein